MQTFPGVGLIVSATVLAEVGDFRRFSYRKAIACYAGLHPPRFRQRRRTQREGHIAKTGSPRDLRWVLQQAAWVAIRCETQYQEDVAQDEPLRPGKKAAAVGIARKLLSWMWAAVLKGQAYQPRVAPMTPA